MRSDRSLTFARALEKRRRRATAVRITWYERKIVWRSDEEERNCSFWLLTNFRVMPVIRLFSSCVSLATSLLQRWSLLIIVLTASGIKQTTSTTKNKNKNTTKRNAINRKQVDDGMASSSAMDSTNPIKNKSNGHHANLNCWHCHRRNCLRNSHTLTIVNCRWAFFLCWGNCTCRISTRPSLRQSRTSAREKIRSGKSNAFLRSTSHRSSFSVGLGSNCWPVFCKKCFFCPYHCPLLSMRLIN